MEELSTFEDEDMGELSEDSDVEDFDLNDDPCGWPDKETAKLIDLYRGHPELYIVSHKWYSHRERKDCTYEKMATEMGCSGR